MASLGKESDEAWEEANKALMDDMPITALYYPSFVALINEDQVEMLNLHWAIHLCSAMLKSLSSC